MNSTAQLIDAPRWLEYYRRVGSKVPAFTTLIEDISSRLVSEENRPPALRAAIATAEVLAEIQADGDSLSAVLVAAMPNWNRERIDAELGVAIGALIDGVKRIRAIDALSDERATPSAPQMESLRKMLLAMAQDMRVVLIKLAEQMSLMRGIAASTAEAQRRAARQTFNLYAPLANRLGVWQLKWELEDLAFRFLEPETYQNVVQQLDQNRSDREKYIEGVGDMLREALRQEGLAVEVQGRPKHIYSIYRKMQEKNLAFDRLYDLRALRVLTGDIRECYSALGVAHNLWQPIPGEFDDYIAQPKGNNYRSLHTAVVGPEGQTLEVQIRTRDMHRESEFGVAAHWRYKEGGKGDRKYDAKIAWLRQVLNWRDEVSAKRSGELLQDSVYVLTPQGQVVDLPRGATPVDFAYHVHTDLGHRCRGARVDGAIVPLNYALQNAQYVDIISAKQGGPSRDWLNATLGYLVSHRAMAKARQWFNHQELAMAMANGRAVLEKEMQRAGKTAVALEHVAAKLAFPGVNELFAAIGHGEITTRQIQFALSNDIEEAAPASLTHSAKALTTSRGILVLGVNNIATVMAKCCKPAPPEAIVGFVTKARGVMVHRADCVNILRLDQERRERMMPADWGKDMAGPFAVDIAVEAEDRNGLLRDISDAMAREHVNVTAANTLTRGAFATMLFTVEVPDLGKLQLLLQSVRNVAGVVRASRKRAA